MAWFKVDDGLHDHRKTRKVRRSHPEKHRDVAPFGIWVLAGSWAGANGTSGFVPSEVLEEWDDEATELAQRLVDAGLWWPTVEDGEPGYGFHDWDERNPANEVDSGRFGNHLRWHVNRAVSNPDCTFCQEGSIAPIRPDDRPDSGTISPPESSPGPSRPDPTDNTTTPDRFDAFWDAYPKRVGKGQARKAWSGAVKKADPGRILEAAGEYAARVGNTETRFIAHPATWLNGERWDDEGTTGARVDDQGRVVLPPLPPKTPWGTA